MLLSFVPYLQLLSPRLPLQTWMPKLYQNRTLTLLLNSALLLDQVPPLALIIYPPWPKVLKLKVYPFETTTFLWHIPIAIQLELHSLILKWKVLLSDPFYRLGSMMANLYPDVFWDLMWKSVISLMSACFNIGENLNLGFFFQIFVLFTDSYKFFWYYFNFLFTSDTLLEIIVFISWLHDFKVSINYYYDMSTLVSVYFYLLGIIATSFFTHTFNY